MMLSILCHMLAFFSIWGNSDKPRSYSFLKGTVRNQQNQNLKPGCWTKGPTVGTILPLIKRLCWNVWVLIYFIIFWHFYSFPFITTTTTVFQSVEDLMLTCVK